MLKLKVIKIFGHTPAFNMYVVQFIRETGRTIAITICDDNKIEEWDIKDLQIDFQRAIK